ncbi:sensor histidine kinase [Paenibacillus tritici]|uniref:ATP-binding protein n=1 Tax=Paenibacillus tritici TaxID=1873425 RepID=UPI001BA94FA0|nr:ATP-binding protein [Paenibacillus tritici]QUL53280.1 sensor histidine kinase [Paenibacillus tritici]
MIPYNLPIILCVLLVMGFQTNFYFGSVFGKSAQKPNRTVYFILYGLLCFVYLVFEMSSVFSSAVALLMIFAMAGSYQVEIKTKVIFSILYAVLMTLVSFISLFIFSAIDSVDYTSLESGNGFDRPGFMKGIILSCIIMFAVIQVIRLISKRRSFALPYPYYIFFLIVPFISIYQINVLTTVSSNKDIYYFMAILGFLFLNVMVVYIFDTIIDKFQFMHENAQLQHQMNYQDANYEKTVHSFKSIKRIIHDTHQQFLYIEECIRRNDSAAALEHIKVTLNKVEDAYQRVNTGHLVIDALVTNTLNIAQANGIRVDTRLRLHSQAVHIDRYDLCVVLGNMLDNAIEASKKVKVAEDRYILIQIHSSESALFIRILNRIAQETASLHSEKPDPEYHGIGLTNISRICDKYGGNMTIESGHKEFNNMVVLPFSPESSI